MLVEEGEQPGTRSLTLVQSGGLVVRSGGKVVSVRPSPEQPEILHTGFIGDVAFLEALEREETGNEQLRFASRGWAEGVHVATSAPCRLLSWPADELRAVLLDDDALKARFVQVLASNVVSKLEAADLTRDLAIPTLRDRQLVDTTGDGLADAALVDTSGDGLPDTIVPLEQLDSDDFFDEMCEAEPGCDPYAEGALSRAAVEELLRERQDRRRRRWRSSSPTSTPRACASRSRAPSGSAASRGSSSTSRRAQRAGRGLRGLRRRRQRRPPRRGLLRHAVSRWRIAGAARGGGYGPGCGMRMAWSGRVSLYLWLLRRRL